MKIDGSDAKMIFTRLSGGQPPPPKWAADLLVGYDNLLRQWEKDLDEYVSQGGSLLRIVSAPVGSGKTHISRAIQAIAAEKYFLVCQIDAQSQLTNDDLSLYEAFCESIKHPKALLEDREESGLLMVMFDVATRLSGSEIRALLRQKRLPVENLGEALGSLVDELRLLLARGGKADREILDGIVALAALLSGQSVSGTRSVAKVRRIMGYPVLRKLSRTPGKRDARLWLESLLLAIRSLGFNGVLLVLDEHDEVKEDALDSHIVQLRRTLDKLTEGHLPGVFAVYFVLDNFKSRIMEKHTALHQRVRNILEGYVPNRLMSEMEDIRDMEGLDFLQILGKRLYALIGDGQMPYELEMKCKGFAREAMKIGRVDTRHYVMRVANEMLERME